MNRVRRRHHRARCIRPAQRARRPLTHLVTMTEALSIFDVGIEIGQHRGEQDTNYDAGWKAGFKAGFDAALEDLRDLGGE